MGGKGKKKEIIIIKKEWNKLFNVVYRWKKNSHFLYKYLHVNGNIRVATCGHWLYHTRTRTRTHIPNTNMHTNEKKIENLSTILICIRNLLTDKYRNNSRDRLFNHKKFSNLIINYFFSSLEHTNRRNALINNIEHPEVRYSFHQKIYIYWKTKQKITS